MWTGEDEVGTRVWFPHNKAPRFDPTLRAVNSETGKGNCSANGWRGWKIVRGSPGGRFRKAVSLAGPSDVLLS